MRFRAVLVDNAAMKDFLTTVNSLSKLSKECVMRITIRHVYFIIPDDDTGPRRPLVWCELPVNFYFREFNLEGVSHEQNEIYLGLSTAMLLKSLSTVKQNAKSLKVKLTNKQAPCLTLEMELTSTEGLQNRHLVHDIPVEVIGRKHWGEYAEPQFNDFHVSMQMPNLKPIKSIVERMKNMGHSLIVSATKFGKLSLRIKTDVVSLTAHFSNLGIESFAVAHNTELLENTNDADATEVNSVVTATIDIKKFLMFLAGMQLNNCRTTCSIVHGKMVKLSCEQPGALSLQCFFTEILI
ncbi:hypothetical protein PPYR_02685 [Photinus pyralis]|uniref:Checkpoint protein n=1 Tax=Photinus pyralis TaxID=7054 RepID=A0A1Y1LJB5_PHOPY|nr:checkpoint protein HUS1-like isoform X2 [Photinus pyralis]XP_031328613.1 checkpoint protein HUS1-like isoform X2 [Photinus pyralis]KAB0804327.1 hypothetical protein PPYR_01297 [Photinus pyralis]KAB0805715.1 hypothetical protein PPYR_02685 [Photinus pyralis]